MRLLHSQEGFVKPLLVVAVLGVAVYVGFQFGIPYFRYSAFESEVKDIARLELSSAERIRAQVLEAAENYKLPIEEKDIVVTKTEKKVHITTAWSVEVDIWGLYRRTLDFTVNVEE